MEPHHEEFHHLVTCALAVLRTIRDVSEHPLAAPAFRYALVEYATPYTRSDGQSGRRFELNNRFVPPEFIELHRRILTARNQIHAHADLRPMQARLTISQAPPGPSISILSRYIDELAEMANLSKVIDLVEGTITNMDVAIAEKRRELQP
jgi:hypothetical protein